MEYRVIRHAGTGSGAERANHKYVARVKTSDGKGYRYFYTNAEYQAYLKETKSNSPTAYDAPYKPKDKKEDPVAYDAPYKPKDKKEDPVAEDPRYDEVHPEKKKQQVDDPRYDEVHPEKKTNVKVKRKKQKEKGEKYVSRMMSTKPTSISKKKR